MQDSLREKKSLIFLQPACKNRKKKFIKKKKKA